MKRTARKPKSQKDKSPADGRVRGEGGRFAKGGPPPAKRLAYHAARVRGRTRRNALADAGYQPSTPESGRALAAKLEKTWQADRAVLAEACRAAGITPARLAVKLSGLLESEESAVALSAYDRAVKALGLDAPAENPDSPIDALSYEQKVAYVRILETFAAAGRDAAAGDAAGAAG